MATLAELIVRIGGDITGVSSAFKATKGLLGGLAKDFSKSAADFERVGRSMGVAGAAIAAGLGDSVRVAATFEQQMSKVQALSGGTKREFDLLRDSAVDLGASTTFSATEAAQGMQNLAAAGFKTSQIIQAMPGILDAAAASGENIATTSDIIVTALKGFGLEAKNAGHVADVLAAASNASAISLVDIGESFKYVAPVARAAGISMEMTAAALAIMGDAGIKGSQGGTVLREALAHLAKGAPITQKAIDALKLSVIDSHGAFIPFDQLIGQLREKFAGLTNAQRLQSAAALFGQGAMSGMLALIDSGQPKLTAMAAGFNAVDGAGHTMATTMTDNLAGAVEQMKGAFESLQIIIGTALTPAVQLATVAVQGIFEAFNALPAPLQNTIAITAAVTAGVLLLGGGLMLLISTVPSVLTGFASLAGIFAAITSPIGLMITALALVAGTLIYLLATNEEVYSELESIWDSICSIFDSSLQFIVNITDTSLGMFTGLWGTTIESMWSVASNAWGHVKEVFYNALFFISDVLAAVSLAMAGNWNGAVDAIMAAGVDIANLGINLAPLKAELGKLWEDIKAGAMISWQAIVDGIKGYLNTIIFAINAFTSRISGMVLFNIPAPIANLVPGGMFLAGDYRLPMIPQIPGLASGGMAMRAGAALIGERGPELLDMPRGARVSPLGRGGAGGGTTIVNNYYITVQGTVVGEDQIWDIARRGGIKHRRSNLSAGLA